MISLNKNKDYVESFECDFLGFHHKFNCVYATYAAGGIALELFEDGEPYMTASTCIPNLEDEEIAIKDYSENEGILDILMEQGVITPPHRFQSSGYVIVPICKLQLAEDTPIYLAGSLYDEGTECEIATDMEEDRTYFRMKDVLEIMEGNDYDERYDKFFKLSYPDRIKALKNMAETINARLDDKWHDIAIDVVNEWKKEMEGK